MLQFLFQQKKSQAGFIYSLLKISNRPHIVAYDGFGDDDEIVVQGHLLKRWPIPRKHYRKSFFINAFSLFRLFMVRPMPDEPIEAQMGNESVVVRSEKDGFFRFSWKPAIAPNPGWHVATVRHLSGSSVNAEPAQCRIFVPFPSQYSFISDIDDTFLISHSSNLLRRLYVLLARNARTRKPFDGVALHYRLLAAGGKETPANPFFYVSGSEWNLYEYITEFCRINEMPQGILLLSQIKTFGQILKTGQGHLNSKYIRIARILKVFPDHQYVLLGDDTQKDPEIYATVVKDFREKIFAVYIRAISKRHKPKTLQYLKDIQDAGVHCCYFKHSSEAIEHSIKIGLISIC